MNTYIGANSGIWNLRTNWSDNDNDWNCDCAITGKTGITLDAAANIGKIGSLTLTDAELQLKNTSASAHAFNIGRISLQGNSTLAIGIAGESPVIVRSGPVSSAGGSVLLVTGGSTVRTGGHPVEVVQYGALVVVNGTVDAHSGAYLGTIHGSGLSTIILDYATIIGNLNSGGNLRVQDFYGESLGDSAKRTSTVSGDFHGGFLFAVNVRSASCAKLAVAGYAYLASSPMPIAIGSVLITASSYTVLTSGIGATVQPCPTQIGSNTFGVSTNATPPTTLQLTQSAQNNNTPINPPPVFNPLDANDAPPPPQYRLREPTRLGYTRPADPPTDPAAVPPGNYRLRNTIRMGYGSGAGSGTVDLGTTGSPLTPPAAPSISAVVYTGSGFITVRWAAVDGASFYMIYAGNGPGTEIPLTSTPLTTYPYYGLPGTTYYFQVVAVGAGGESIVSNEVSAVMP